eukprot:TRINITY_DN18088_c0_g2_i1.p1 TRINITY_DN18088_c0_g2~~TRINITY_DN18088_c0_g2_i1.p1  ORF type:complete len:324 (+),score=63.74 TRINITY_DN18088_c0_g2_i1:34-1005(+)
MGAKMTSTQAKAVETVVQGLGPLPEVPDAGLTSSSSCEVLNTTTGLVKGCWGKFHAEAFYRPFPAGFEGLRPLRHILIAALDIERYAAREGEEVEVEMLGEGSYAKVFGCGPVAAKIISDRERQWVHRAAVENSLLADKHSLGPAIFGYGKVQQLQGGRFQGTVIFMERLEPLGEDWNDADTACFLKDVRALSKVGFHNDLKLVNLLRRHKRPLMIDFDLMSQWKVQVAVTSSCIEHDFQPWLEPLGEDVSNFFREYYDLFSFSLTLEDGSLYRAVLARLLIVWKHIEAPVLQPLLTSIDREKLLEIPFEDSKNKNGLWTSLL